MSDQCAKDIVAADHKETSFSSKLHPFLIFLAGVALVSIIAVLCFYMYHFSGSLSVEQAHWAQFGDYVGGTLGPVLAFIAILALLATLKIQNDEFRVATVELANSAAALQEQTEHLSTQGFENCLFRMLSLHRSLIDGLSLETYRGQEALVKISESFIEDQLMAVRKGDYTDVRNGFEREFSLFLKGKGRYLTHYLNSISTVLAYIDKSSVSDKRQYFEIVRSQVSNAEFPILFVFGVVPRGEKFRSVVQRFGFFSGMTEKEFDVAAEMLSLYSPAAYRN